MTALNTLSDLNQRHREFWAQQEILMNARIKDELLKSIAQENMESEIQRQVPVFCRLSFEQELADAERVAKKVLTYKARQGGKALKRDALQGLILEIVKRQAEISEAELRSQLISKIGMGIIEYVNDDEIDFKNIDGNSKTAALSGLKDRLSRAKKEIRSR